MKKKKGHKKNKKFNKNALLAALILSIGAAQANPSSLFNLSEFNSYLPHEILAGCGAGCGGEPTPSTRQASDDEDEDEALNNDDPATLNECKQNCKDDFPGKANKKDRKSCIND